MGFKHVRHRIGHGVPTATALCLVLIATPEAADEYAGEGWQPGRQVDGIELYRRPVAGSAFMAVRACSRFGAPPVRLYRILTDYGQFEHFVPDVAESRVLWRQGQRQQVYQRLELSAPLRDRHYVIHSEGQGGVYGSEPLSIRWSLDAVATARLPDLAVVPLAFSGNWRLSASAGGQATRACYSLHVDPGGHLPAWLFVRQLENYVIRVIRAIMRRLLTLPGDA